MVLLSNEEFLSQLLLITQSARAASSFTVTFKRYDGYDRPVPRAGRPPLPSPGEYRCLVRAQSKSRKLSTIVNQDDVPRIMEGYAKVMKSSMDGLKKVKKIKGKAKATG